MRQKGDLSSTQSQKQETSREYHEKPAAEVSAGKVAPATPVRRHRGDIMSPETRSAVMARIKGKGTAPELMVAAMLDGVGYTYESHVKALPGRPDFVLQGPRVVILVDGDFWHGWRFSEWRDKLSPKWEAKIEANRRRDARNIRELRRLEWRVVRLWEHQLKKSPSRCLARVRKAVNEGLAAGMEAASLDDHEPALLRPES